MSLFLLCQSAVNVKSCGVVLIGISSVSCCGLALSRNYILDEGDFIEPTKWSASNTVK